MKVKTISYQRVKNLGNYESERMEMTVEVNEDEDINLAVKTLKEYVLQGLDINPDDGNIAF